MNPVWLYVIAWLLPLASFIVLVLGGKHWGKAGGYIACLAIFGSFLLSLAGFVSYANQAEGLFTGHHQEATHAAAPDATSELSQNEQQASVSEHSQEHAEHADSALAWTWSFTWIDIGGGKLTIPMGFYVDHLTAIMFLMVSFVAFLIHVYSIGYMDEELHNPVRDPLAVPAGQPPLERKGRFPRFFTYMSLFCFSMLGLVLADNVLFVFVFWELVGLCSYLLIGFYYERDSASTAANKAFITNRIGDAGMIIGMMIILTSLGTFNIQDIGHTIRDAQGEIVRIDKTSSQHLYFRSTTQEWLPEGATEGTDAAVRPGEVMLHDPETGEPLGDTMPYALLVAAGIAVFTGCVGKSAQFPLHVWLPDAMEGPTPVSALIHAATMVAAGVYFVGRFYALFAYETLLVIAYVGGITLFMAGTIALVMTDIKRVLAYSTVSQLGYMMLGLGVGGWAAGLFHLLTHAFFKALLFLCSGSVIHGSGTQEMPQMGGLWRKMPITCGTMFVGVLAISGIPWFSGYFSKDAIIAQSLFFWDTHSQHALLFFLPVIGAAITAFYMFRLFFMTFTGKPRDQHVHEHAHESPAVMWLPLVILAVFSVVVGWPLVTGAPLLETMLNYGPPIPVEHPPADLHTLAGGIALGVVVIGIFLAVLFYSVRLLNPADLPRQFPRLYRFLANKWYFDELYHAVLIRPALSLAQYCRRFDWNILDGLVDGSARMTVKASDIDGWIDFRIVDGAVNWVGDWVYAVGDWLRYLQTGQLRQYVVFLAVAAVGLGAFFSFLGPTVLGNFLGK